MEYQDEKGRRWQTRYRLTAEEAFARFGATANRVEHSREVRTPLGHTSDFLKRS